MDSLTVFWTNFFSMDPKMLLFVPTAFAIISIILSCRLYGKISENPTSRILLVIISVSTSVIYTEIGFTGIFNFNFTGEIASIAKGFSAVWFVVTTVVLIIAMVSSEEKF